MHLYEITMLFLFTIYEFWSSMIWVEYFQSPFPRPDTNSEADIFVKAVTIVLCTAGIAFYVRFLVAIWKDSKPRSGGYWLRLRSDSGEITIDELPEERKPVSRAA